MARSFVNYKATSYIGTIFSVPISLGAGSVRAKGAPISINWLTYGAGTANPNNLVQLNFATGNNIQSLAQIRAVYIDNSNSNYAISVIFPDTNFVVNAQPNSAAFYPVMSNSLQPFVAITGVQTGYEPTTNLIFTDVFLPPYADLETSFITSVMQNSLGGFYYPAAGDLFVEVHIATDSAVATTVFPSYASGMLVVTGMIINLMGINNVTGNQCTVSTQFYNQLTGANIVLARAISTSGVPADLVTTIYNQSNLCKVFAVSSIPDLIFRASTAPRTFTSGEAQLMVNYTHLP